MFYKSFETIDNAGSELIQSDDALQAFLQKYASEHRDDKPARKIESAGPEDRDLAEVDQDKEELDEEEEEAARDAETAGA